MPSWVRPAPLLALLLIPAGAPASFALWGGEAAPPPAPSVGPAEAVPWQDQIPGRAAKGLEYFRHAQDADGGFTTPMRTTSVIHNAQMVFFYETLGLLGRKRAIVDGLMRFIWSQQQPDGGFGAYPGGPSKDDHSVQAYLAAKIAGEDEGSPRMRALERFIREHESVPKARIARLFLVLFQLQKAPPLPPGTLPLAMKAEKHLAYVSALLYPSLYLIEGRHFHPLRDDQVPRALGLETIPADPPRSVPGEKAMFRWLLARAGSDGTVYDYDLITMPALLAFFTQGERYQDLLTKALATLEGRMTTLSDGSIHESIGDAGVGETLAALWTFIELGVSPGDPVRREAERYLWSRQHLKGGFGFSSRDEHLPDVDTTAATAFVLQRSAREEGGDAGARLKGTVDYLLSMQNPDGGFGTYARRGRLGIGARLLKRIAPAAPVSDSVAEQTTRVVLALSSLPETARLRKAVDRAVRWLRGRQRADGSFAGDWFVGYSVGTAWALNSLGTRIDRPEARAAAERALGFIESQQRADGGFGESPAADEESRVVPLERSSPAQTGMVAMLLMNFARTTDYAYWPRLQPLVERAVKYLFDTQGQDGLWHDPAVTATVGPRFEYLIYPYIQELQPLQALGMYPRVAAEAARRAAERLRKT